MLHDRCGMDRRATRERERRGRNNNPATAGQHSGNPIRKGVQQTATGGLALFRMKLHGEHSLPSDRGGKLAAVIDPADDIGRAIRNHTIGVYKVEAVFVG